MGLEILARDGLSSSRADPRSPRLAGTTNGVIGYPRSIPDNMLSTPVVISNDGMLAINKITHFTYIREVTYTPTAHMQRDFSSPAALDPPTIEAGEKHTVPIDQFLFTNIPIQHADIAIVLAFTPEYIPLWRKERVFHFVTVRQSDGKLRFVQQYSSEIQAEIERERKRLNFQTD